VTDILKQAFGNISGGRVLDGATGEGVFIRTLVENLKGFVEVIGIDLYEYTKDAGSIFTTENVYFSQMDASRLGFENETFNTLSLSNSLHHMKEISPCIIEMKRVLKPGGHFIFREVHGDIQSEPQFTDMYIHHWVAEIDSAFGDIHNKTFSRQGLVDLINGVGLRNVKFYDTPIRIWTPGVVQKSRKTKVSLIDTSGLLKKSQAIRYSSSGVRSFESASTRWVSSGSRS